MSIANNLRRLRKYRRSRKDYEPFTLLDMLMDAEPGHPVQVSSVEIRLFGFRARSNGKTGFAALKALREEHPVLVHGLCTYLSVSWFLVALVMSLTISR
ncbi:hypothetical protein H9W91_18470 [Streptomyces alfalfae]|uniref:hypothetical protein n=1 Tax=Streptomyces alfalfae TaxID=1642299 RepID=UPI001BA9CDD8|nr:hypothetical protein [Streptomyces alfalfae]QUI32620.1 hypothetical protein H9W91_18470 [Streptomyces alfalfae]